MWATSAYMLRLCINPRQYISPIHLMHVNVQESMRKSCRYTQCIRTRILYYKPCENLNQVVQVMQSVSGTASHIHCAWMWNEIGGLYDEIIITPVPSYTWKISLICYLACTPIALQMQQQNLCIFWYSFLLWWHHNIGTINLFYLGSLTNSLLSFIQLLSKMMCGTQ